MTTTAAFATPLPESGTAPAPRRGRLAQLGADSSYALSGLPIAIVSFSLLVTLTAVSIGLVVIWIGVPLLAITLGTAHGFAASERRRLALVLPGPVVHPHYARPAPGAGALARVRSVLGDPQRWMDLAHGVVRLVVSIPAFVIVVTWWSVTLAGLTYGLYDWALPPSDSAQDQDLLELVGLPSSTFGRIASYTLIGLLFAVLLPFVVRGAALLEGGTARLMLNSRASMQAEIGRLAGGRDAAVAAEAVSLRRLERDIHDGPQQRLVRLSMDLHRAQRQVDSDPAAARATLAEAAEQTRETLEELRALSRGIAPPVLADRGLAAALAAVAARSPVPVELTVDLPAGARLPEAAENTAYFVVSEALANVAKHSDASGARVEVLRLGDRLQVTIEDDGPGGAVLAPGHGLAGLTDRLRAVDGVLVVDSPRGGPTRLVAELPCR
jgi:signal transduction histidine kinase